MEGRSAVQARIEAFARKSAEEIVEIDAENIDDAMRWLEAVKTPGNLH